MVTGIVAWRRTNDLILLGYLSQRKMERKRGKELKEIAYKKPEKTLSAGISGSELPSSPRFLTNGRASMSSRISPPSPDFDPFPTGNITGIFRSHYCQITAPSWYFSVITFESRLFPPSEVGK